VTSLTEIVTRLLAQLPDPRTAQLLLDRLIAENRSLERTFQRDPGLLSDVLTIAAWSPLLATTLENNPDYVTWLQRERKVTRVRTREELGESLGRFALINSQINPHVMLARFRRRELLRTYLHDIRRTRTIVETTEELSSLADAILEYGLKLCRQELDNRYGSPQRIDGQGRISSAEFCVVALGKLGSLELNYASDIDLIFLFSDEGTTSAGGSGDQITNREYFVKLAERLLKLVGEPAGEGASYRIDARLRPHGREGALACSVGEAVNYYQRRAADWELQMLIRARAAAGNLKAFSKFAESIEDSVYRPNLSVAQALGNVREAKQQIDIQHERSDKGFNVKLGRGGIREIEFIAQALELAFGGDDPWLRTAHTLVTLGRLAERSLISEREHSQLSDAYHFLRALEHRLQMEHGLQTHSVPIEAAKCELIARRMNFTGDNALHEFEDALKAHTDNVHAAFDRVFAEVTAKEIPTPRSADIDDTIVDRAAEIARTAARVFGVKPEPHSDDQCAARMADLLERELAACGNGTRAMSFLSRITAAFEKDREVRPVKAEQLATLIRVLSASEFFGEMIASRPALIYSLPIGERPLGPRHYENELADAVTHQTEFADELTALRLKWSELLIEIGARDAAGTEEPSQINRSLTDLARGAANAALLSATRELERRYGALSVEPRIAILGLGRFGSGGMDYGSDLDVMVVYDARAGSPVKGLTQEEVYARLTEYFVATLSSITRAGVLYRVDLRLRPDGQKGPLATSSATLINYLESRAAIWEWLAYVKLRAAAGDMEFGSEIETIARGRIHELARQADVRQLAAETRRVRDRLQKAKAPRRRAGLNIKHGAGGMLDVYFAVRYLQLRDNVPDDGEDRTTRRMLQRLREVGSIDEADFQRMFAGYQLLRSVDHQRRLIAGRSATVPPYDATAFMEIAERLGYATANDLRDDLISGMKDIRVAYDHIISVE
jgi:[glutamine synthetase] adenylyltransferase / [glutamine synthetase]-adenylyl-L-tyrosine phosphorylase